MHLEKICNGKSIFRTCGQCEKKNSHLIIELLCELHYFCSKNL